MKKLPFSKQRLKAALVAGASVAALQSTGAHVAAAQDDSADEVKRLNSVTVSATKRESTLQDVPIAVSVVDQGVIERAEIQDLRGLQTLVPSLTVAQLSSSVSAPIAIRGFGNGANNFGIEPSVGVFIDGVYRSRAASQIADLPNLDRVEVLRGPQSTLFGKNASVGVLSVVTQEPQFEQSGSVSATAGNFNALRLNGDITGPISDKLAYSLSGTLNQRDGHAINLETGNDANERDRWGLRGQLLFVPNDKLKFRVIADYDDIDESCCIGANLINGPTGAAIQAVGGQINFEDPFSYDVFTNFDSTNEVTNSGISLHTDYEGSKATLTSITAYRSTEAATNQDSDFSSADIIGENIANTDISTFTQEVRLTSNDPDSRVDWMIGAFYFDEYVETDSELLYGDDYRAYLNVLAGGPGAFAGLEAASLLPPATLAAAGQGPSDQFTLDNQAWSVFGTLDFHITDRLTATVGLSYTDDEKEVTGQQTNTDVFSAINLTQAGYNAILSSQLAGLGVNISNPLSIVPFIQNDPVLYAQLQQGSAAAAQNPALNPFAPLAPLQFLPPFVDFPNAVEGGRTNDTDTSYTLRLAYDITDNVNVYVSYATGFKASSWNLSRNSRPLGTDFIAGATIVDPVTQQVIVQPISSPITDADLGVANLTSGTRFAGPEETEVYEIGLKASFDDVAINLAIFDQIIDGFQSNSFTGSSFALANAGQQSTQGVELDVTWTPIDALTLRFAGAFYDPVFDSFTGAPGGDLTGQTPSGIPDASTTVSADYEFTIGPMPAFFRADWQHFSDSEFFNDANDNALIAPGGYTRGADIVNASLGVFASHGISATVWARNVFEEEFITTAFRAVVQTGSFSGFPSEPRTYGVTIHKKF